LKPEYYKLTKNKL